MNAQTLPKVMMPNRDGFIPFSRGNIQAAGSSIPWPSFRLQRASGKRASALTRVGAPNTSIVMLGAETNRLKVAARLEREGGEGRFGGAHNVYQHPQKRGHEPDP